MEDLHTINQLDLADIYTTLQLTSTHVLLTGSGESPVQTTGSAIRQASVHFTTLKSHKVCSLTIMKQN